MTYFSVRGIRAGLDLFERAARQLQNSEKADLAKAATDMIVTEKAVQANALAFRTSAEMSQRLLDIFT
jgi:flagellar hook protein FlgE